MLALFLVGAFLMRSAGCVINDMIDRKVDAQVARTKHRPLASGEMNMFEAFFLAVLLLSMALALLLTLNQTTILLGCIIVVPVFIYPFMKRVTYWPQVFLAFTFNWGALMGWTAITGEVSLSAILLYAACMFWTLGYDTIYAHQDKEDDVLLGIKSTALRLGSYTRKYLYIFYGGMIGLLWVLGMIQAAGIGYYVGLILAGFLLLWQANTVKLNHQADCMQKFNTNRYIGLIIFAGILLGKVS